MIPRHELYGPVIFGPIGGVGGVALAMLFLYDEAQNRVYIVHSLPLAVAGVVVGLAVGRAVMWAYLRYPRLRAVIEVTGTALLLAGTGAVVGWLAGDKREGNPPAEMVWGSLGGLALGAAISAAGLAWDRLRSSGQIERSA
jgi:hypothetical protein